MSLTKADIVERVYKEAGFSKKEASDLVELVFNTIKDTLSKGEKVKISGFGNFSIRDKSTRVGRNPQTGDAMEITARRVLSFKPSQVLKEDITGRYAHRLDEDGNEDKSISPKDGASRALTSFVAGQEEEEDGNEF
ncbi:MAG: integration host factor subunit alpha [Bdellovibrionales bacterium RIFOXYB1_FULL_37_110]|nr:MAG: integration host factor subunit alpha [Bdellovibrionales bacterium RIFOXYA1_FULL_38_20]OFZ49258.1 MAG: integration host factor subunit alpha [Bdellovibrionales bacterium RIFOXYC1_FULL_37_79]OFZ58506.1 MAG: integration host factor subunit alpha [Bdellovibrionales bacterium RIFOXYB1_FULL_37_110]OFZ61519.1 MAG: integration host factor subunit alpha [Bdellovibrionales bacterium RIFOXYD1_FULL_36_51]